MMMYYPRKQKSLSSMAVAAHCSFANCTVRNCSVARVQTIVWPVCAATILARLENGIV